MQFIGASNFKYFDEIVRLTMTDHLMILQKLNAVLTGVKYYQSMTPRI